MNWITISGIIVICIGTFLTYYGSSLSSNKDKNEITSKIEKFQKQIEDVKNKDISSIEKLNKINAIENEFNSWAEQFQQNKEEKKIALEKNEITLRENKNKLTKEWKPFYTLFFSSLTQIVDAYNRSTKSNKISIISNTSLPDNIYDAKPEQFNVIIEFNENIFWVIWLKIRDPREETEIPTICINITNTPKTPITYFGDLEIKCYPDLKIMSIGKFNEFEKIEFESKYPLNFDTKKHIDILKQAFEFQILNIEK